MEGHWRRLNSWLELLFSKGEHIHFIASSLAPTELKLSLEAIWTLFTACSEPYNLYYEVSWIAKQGKQCGTRNERTSAQSEQAMRNKRNFLTRDAAEQQKHRKERDRSNAEQNTCHKQQKNKRSFETRVVISDLLFWRYLFFTCAIFSKINSCRNGF